MNALVRTRILSALAGLVLLMSVAGPASAGLASGPPAAAGQPAAAATSMAVPVNQAPSTAVALAPQADGSQAVFYRGEDDAVYRRTFNNGTWSGESSLGGLIVGAPAATAVGTADQVVAARGRNGALYLRTFAQGVWGGWQSIGGILSAAPAVVGSTDGRLDVFVRGTNNALYTRTRSGGGTWSAWTSLGGAIASGPAAVAFSSGRIDVYAVGTDFSVVRRSLTSGVWSGWASMGGRTYTAPAAARAPNGGALVFVRGTSNALYSNAGSGWQARGGLLIDAPAAGATSTGGVDVIVRGQDNALWSTMLRAGTWSAFQRGWIPAAPTSPASSLLGTDWTRIATTRKVVALTFDAGGNANGLTSIRKTLQTKNAAATFYLTGSWTRTFPAGANEVAIAGFRVGNHTDTHPHLPALTDTQVRAQVLNAEVAVLRTTGADPRPLFRFPFGDVNAHALSLVNDLNYVAVRWTVDSLGWQGTSGGQSTQLVVNRVLAAAQPGAIVLMHVGSNPDDGTTLDAAALPQIIDGYRARGYTFVTLNELIGR
jgi:peptidoglycan/xylan/chitin deacetylase (PgdA/CDA1 family)